MHLVDGMGFVRETSGERNTKMSRTLYDRILAGKPSSSNCFTSQEILCKRKSINITE